MFRHMQRLDSTSSTSKIIMDASRMPASRDRIMLFMSEHADAAQVSCAKAATVLANIRSIIASASFPEVERSVPYIFSISRGNLHDTGKID